MAFALGPTGFKLLAPGDQLNKVKIDTHLSDFMKLYQDVDGLFASVMKNRKSLLIRAYEYNKDPALKKLYEESQKSKNQSKSKTNQDEKRDYVSNLLPWYEMGLKHNQLNP